jgi:transposase-like protein
MYVQGVSTRKVKDITEQLCGREISSSQVSRLAAQLDEELEGWRSRKLGATRYLVLDATYVKVRHAGSVLDCAVLIAAGVRADGKRSILGCSVSLSEAEVHLRGFLESLVDRGLHGVELVTSDDHSGLKAALKAILPSVAWQRCQVHLQRNAVAYVPRVDMRSKVASDIRSVFNAPDRHEAERLLKIAADRYRESAPRLAEWMEANLPEGLNVFALPEHHRRRLRTSNMLERLNRELSGSTESSSGVLASPLSSPTRPARCASPPLSWPKPPKSGRPAASTSPWNRADSVTPNYRRTVALSIEVHALCCLRSRLGQIRSYIVNRLARVCPLKELHV